MHVTSQRVGVSFDILQKKTSLLGSSSTVILILFVIVCKPPLAPPFSWCILASLPRCLYTFSWPATPSFLASSCCQKAGVQIGHWRRLAGNQQKHTYSKIGLISCNIPSDLGWSVSSFSNSQLEVLRRSNGAETLRFLDWWNGIVPWLVCCISMALTGHQIWRSLDVSHNFSDKTQIWKISHTGLHHTQYTPFCVLGDVRMPPWTHEQSRINKIQDDPGRMGLALVEIKFVMISISIRPFFFHQGLNSQRVDFHRNFNTFKLVLWRQGVMMIQTW